MSSVVKVVDKFQVDTSVDKFSMSRSDERVKTGLLVGILALVAYGLIGQLIVALATLVGVHDNLLVSWIVTVGCVVAVAAAVKFIAFPIADKKVSKFEGKLKYGAAVVKEALLLRGFEVTLNYSAATLTGSQSFEAVGHNRDEVIVSPHYRDGTIQHYRVFGKFEAKEPELFYI